LSDPEPLRDVLAGSPLLMTPEEAATALRIGRTTVYALMKAGELRPVHIGRSCRLPRTEVERYVRSLAAPADRALAPTGQLGATPSQHRQIQARRGISRR
jgi:excisionase family DNA binding protein